MKLPPEVNSRQKKNDFIERKFAMTVLYGDLVAIYGSVSAHIRNVAARNLSVFSHLNIVLKINGNTMKDLTYLEQLEVLNELPLSAPFTKKDSPECVADFLVHALYGARLSDIKSQKEPFRVISNIAILTVSEDGSEIKERRPEYVRVINLFRGTLELKRKLAFDIMNLKARNPSNAIKSALQEGLSECVSDIKKKYL